MSHWMSSKFFSPLAGTLLCLVILTACTGAQPAAPPATPTSPPAAASTAALPLPTASVTPQPSPTPAESVLTICMGAEPESLFIYGSSMLAQSQVLQAIYDGPIDTRGYAYQPVILEKLPSLADGDAVLEPVTVEEGDRVVNNAGQVVELKTGEVVRPFGCNRSDCALTWDGSPLEMAQLSATFTLLEGLNWSDGEPLTAADSVFSYQVALDCLASGACYPGGLMGDDRLVRTAAYTALDTRTTRWSGLPGYLDPGYRTNFFHPLPQHHIADLSVDEMLESPLTTRTPLGWGPYQITGYQPGVKIELVPNPFYFRADENLPAFDRLVYRFVDTSQPQLDLIVSGECDILEYEASSKMIGEEQMGSLLEMDANGQVKVYFSTGTVWEHADFSLGHADYDDGYQPTSDRPDLFGDVRTRQAIALCMDRQKVVDTVFYGKSSVPDTYLPAGHPLFNPQAARYEFNPVAGSMLLEQVGWIDNDGDPATPRVAQGVPDVPDGTLLSFNYTTTTAAQRQLVTQILDESLAACGIQANLEYLPAADFFADPPLGALFSRRFDMAQFSWLTGANPPCELFTSDNIPGDPAILNAAGEPRFPLGWLGQNVTGYHNPAFDEACQSAKEALPEMPAYTANHLTAQEIFAQDLPVIPLFLRIKFAISRPDLCGLEIDPTATSELWNIENFNTGAACP